MSLMNQGAEVLAFHTGSTAVMVAAQERGKLAVAYHSDMRQIAPDAQIAGGDPPVGRLLHPARQGRAGGHWKSGSVWGGVKAKA